MEQEVSWQLFYDERPQTEPMKSDNIEAAVKKAQGVVSKILWETNNKATQIFPDETLWELRVYGKQEI